MKHTILFLFFTSLFVATFQNCSDVGFNPEDETTRAINSTSDNDIDIVVEEGSFLHKQGVEPFSPKTGSLEILLLIDDSSSNAPFVKKVLNGIENLINKLPKDVLSVSAYTLAGSDSISKRHRFLDLDGTSSRTDLTADGSSWRIDHIRPMNNNPISSLRNLGSLNNSQLIDAKQDFINTIKNHLDREIDNDTQSAPFMFCDVLAHLSQKIGRSSNNRTVFIAITDEDDSVSEYGGCTKTSSTTQNWQSNGIKVKVSIDKDILSDTGEVTSTRQQLLTIPSATTCSDLTLEKVNQAIASYPSNYRVNNNTLGSCTDREERSMNSTGSYARSWTGRSPVPAKFDELRIIMNSVGQSQVFFGLFSILSEDDKASEHQSVATNAQEKIKSFLPPSNYSFHSLIDERYDKFISKVVNFKTNTEVNRVSISDLFAKVPAGKKLVVQDVVVYPRSHETAKRVALFSVQGFEIVLHDTAINLSQGADLDIVYTFE